MAARADSLPVNSHHPVVFLLFFLSFQHTSLDQLAAAEAGSSITTAGQWLCVLPTVSVSLSASVFVPLQRSSLPSLLRWRLCSTWPNARYLLHPRAFFFRSAHLGHIYSPHGKNPSHYCISAASERFRNWGTSSTFIVFLFSFVIFCSPSVFDLPNCTLLCLHCGLLLFSRSFL